MKQKSPVYFTDMRTRPGLSLPDKLERLVRRAGIETIDFERKFVAVKIHFGELGNLSFLRPNYAKRLVDVLKPLGAKPFLTDCNTLYVGSRKNALDHLDCAMENGFGPLSTGCQIIIADGLKGTDETIVPLAGTEYVREAKIGHAIMDADVIISLNHFKGHECTGFGGAIKNLGMGCGSRAGKMEQHNAGKPQVNESKCRKCKTCGKECGQDAISYDERGIARIDTDKCVGCGRCIGACNFDAIENTSGDSNEMLSKKMAEYALAVVRGRPQFHINIVTQVSPFCDCHGENDIPIIPDVGMFASFDAVAVDQACADACNRQPVMGGSVLERVLKKAAGDGAAGENEMRCDHFTTVFSSTNWRDTLAHAEKVGVGTRDYELVRV
ncbi:putative Fe-S center protein [Ereboglobus sp. PH5-10]|uniref:DUF362 domain-containing protein n=1 Tax=Ereboglobus sp. PH5-10 TaxID=2940629 RepID=UPI002406B7EE|nr:DUF362 domain-containing protein [Ereboglobus sp. PH5-10]MDF9828298.1 putative Fe-S center protein [Ereboglobus sp. PH5-10]